MMKHIQTIILLALIILFAGCNTYLNPENGASGSEKIARVQVDIGGNARTILPDLDNDFSKYVISAESADGSQNAPAPVTLINNRYGYIDLPYGAWIITVRAYINIAGADYAAAWGSASLMVDTNYHNLYLSVNAPQAGGTGTFNYAVSYPANGSASIKLEPWPLGQAAVFNETINGDKSYSVPSGVYFLTVTATANNRTVTRNDIVHIYDKSPTNVNYVFTKLDFGDMYLNLSGTVKVLVNGVQPNQVYLWCSTEAVMGFYQILFNFSGNDGSATWSISLSDLAGAATLNFYASPTSYPDMRKAVTSIPIPIDDTADINLGTVELNIDSLPANTWVNGNITIPYGEDWYSTNVTAGTTYYFWVNNGYVGDGSKTLLGNFEAIYSNGNNIGGTSNAWYDPVSFTADYSGTVYIRVHGWENTGSYAIGYSTNSYWHNNSLNPANAVPLSANTWVDGDITTPNTVDLYSIDVIAGTRYYFWWNDSYRGDDSKTMDVYVTAYTSDWDYIFDYDSAWVDPVSFTADYSGKVYIRVRAYYGGGTGTYAIGYSTNSSWHNNSFNPANAVPLTADTWVNGNITTPYAADWYSINVTAGTTYYFWWNDSGWGDGSKTLDVDVYAYTSDSGNIFSVDSAWYDPVSFTAYDSGTVYIRVRAYNGRDSTGTYAIMYSDRPRGNVGVEIRTAFEQNENLYLYTYSGVSQGYELWASIEYNNWWPNYNPVVAYSWYINGVLQNGLTGYEVYLPTTGLSPGLHYGLAVVTIDGAEFSREFSFQVYEW